MTSRSGGPARRLLDRLAVAMSGTKHLPATAAIVLVLAVPQVYLLPEGSIDVSLATIATLLMAPVVLLGTALADRRLLRVGLLQVLLALLTVRLFAMLWSPEPRAGLPLVALLGQFIVTIMLLFRFLAQGGAVRLRRVQWAYWPWVLGEACLVVLFRFLPEVEDSFLRAIGGYFAGHNTIAALYGDSPNNVFDVAKSGGVFVNANVAAMFLGINGLAALAMAAVTDARWVRVVGIVTLVAVPFTGSKSATVLVVVLPALAFAVGRLSRGRSRRTWWYWAGPVALVGLGGALLATNRTFLNMLVEAFLGRTVIWEFGVRAFRDDPLLGLGYGGWDAGFGRYALEHDVYRSFPPHNLLLAAWSMTGIIGLALTVAFFALLFRLLVQRFRGDEPRGVSVVTYAGAALSWVLIQGMGENTDVFGDIHLLPVVALLIAYLIRPVGEESKDRATASHSRHRAAPAVPAVGDLHHQPGAGTAELPAVVHREGSGATHPSR